MAQQTLVPEGKATATPMPDDTMIVFKAELPGLKKEDVQLEIEDGYLVIRGETRSEEEVNKDGYYRMQRTFGSFYRSAPLPFDVKPEQITASVKDGILEVRMPAPAPVDAEPTAMKIPIT